MQLLLNTMNAEVVTKLAAICYEMSRHMLVSTGDTSNAPWKDITRDDRREWQKVVQDLLDGNFVVEQPSTDMSKDEEMAHQQMMLIRTTVLSVLSIWSGDPHMGPQIPPLPYVPPRDPEPEPEPKPKPKPKSEDDVTVVDDEEEEELSPQQKAARTRAANKAKAD